MFPQLSSARGALMPVAAICVVALSAAATQTANAATINSFAELGIWNGLTPGATATSPSQQGLPTATGLFGGPLPLIAGPSPFVAAINYNDTAASPITGFFASDSPTTAPPVTCTLTCGTTTISSGNFARATVIEFTFVETVAETFSVTHDDGVSLFRSGTENSTNSNDLLPLSVAAPTTSRTDSLSIGPGVYDLWFAEVNGLPAVLEATSTPLAQTPLPAALPLFVGGLGMLAMFGRRRKSKGASGRLNIQ